MNRDILQPYAASDDPAICMSEMVRYEDRPYGETLIAEFDSMIEAHQHVMSIRKKEEQYVTRIMRTGHEELKYVLFRR